MTHESWHKLLKQFDTDTKTIVIKFTLTLSTVHISYILIKYNSIYIRSKKFINLSPKN